MTTAIPDTHTAGRNGGSTELTTRQREVLARVRSGLTNREIARELGITEEGVKAHLARLYLRFGVRNRVQLIGVAAASLEPGVDARTRLSSLRTIAVDARRRTSDLEHASVSRPNGELGARFAAVQQALVALDASLELAAALPPTTTGKALRVLRKHMTDALAALHDLEKVVA